MKALIIGIVLGTVFTAWLTSRSRNNPARPGLPPLYYDPLARDLVKSGRYVLPCGGGVFPEPRRAVSELLEKYGEEGLRECCLLYLFDHSTDMEYPEGTDKTAEGIVYLLADKETIPKLLQIRERLENLPPLRKPVDDYRYVRNPLERCEWLLAAVCYRLNKPLPDGILPIENFTESQILE